MLVFFLLELKKNRIKNINIKYLGFRLVDKIKKNETEEKNVIFNSFKYRKI